MSTAIRVGMRTDGCVPTDVCRLARSYWPPATGHRSLSLECQDAPPSRTRRILKWTGASLCVLILAAWGISLRWVTAMTFGRTGLFCVTDRGFLEFGILSYLDTLPKPRFEVVAWQGFGIGWPSLPHTVGSLDIALAIPFWLLLLLTAIPTAWLWHRDRRLFSSPPDHLLCRGCGYDYDLSGNLSGVCPECGEKVHPPAVLADPEFGEKTAKGEETVESSK